MTTHLLLRGYGPEGLDCTPVALLELDAGTYAEIMQWVGEAKRLAEKSTSFSSIEIHYYGADWINIDRLDQDRVDVDNMITLLDNQSYAVLDPDSDLCTHILARADVSEYDGGARMRTECDVLEVADDGIKFKMYPKHTDFRVHSYRMYLRELEALDLEGV